MARIRRKRLSWFRFFVDDFRGGTELLTSQCVGQYVRCLCAQWDSKSDQRLPDDPESLSLILRGEALDPRVRAKFGTITVGDQKYLRNQRLAEEWAASKAEYEGKSRRRKSAVSGADTAPVSATHTAPEPEPEPDVTDTTYLPTARARAETPRLDLGTAEGQTELRLRKLRNTLGERLKMLAEHPNSRLSVWKWCKRVSAYKTRKGEQIEGTSDYRSINSIDRLEKSIADADWWMDKMVKGRKVGDGPR